MQIKNIRPFFKRKNNTFKIAASKQFSNKNNLSFTSLKIPVYVVGEDKQRRRFDSYKDAAQGNTGIYTKISSALNTNPSAILQGKTFIKAQEIEYTDTNGTNKVDEIKYQAMLSYPYTKPMDLVLISLDGTYQEFKSLRQCAKQLNIRDDKAYDLLYPSKNINDFILVNKQEVSAQKDDILIIDSEKIKTIYEKQFRTKLEPVYTLSKDGDITQYASLRAYSKKTGVRHNVAINNIGNDKKRILQNSILLTQNEITTQDENGTRTIDQSKIELLFEKYFNAQYGLIYTISTDGRCKAYFSTTQCAKALGVNKCEVEKALNKEKLTLNDNIIVRANEITQEDGNRRTLNQKKIEEIYQLCFNTKLEAIYKINENGEYEKFASIKDATTKTKIPKNDITKLLNKKCLYLQDFTFIYAHEIENDDGYGKITLNEEKIRKIIDTSFPLIRRPIFAIKIDGSIQKYNTLLEFAQEHNILQSNAARIVNQKRVTKEGYILALESEVVSTGEQGVRYIDSKKIEVLKKHFQRPKEAIYAISKEGKYIKLNSIDACAEYFKIKKASVYSNLSSNRKTSTGYIFVWAKEIETSENMDKKEIENKIKEIIKNNFKPEAPKKKNKEKTKNAQPIKNTNNIPSNTKKFCIIDLDSRKYKITPFNESVGKFLNTDENTLLEFIKKRKLFKEKYAVIDFLEISDNGELDITKLKKELAKYLAKRKEDTELQEKLSRLIQKEKAPQKTEQEIDITSSTSLFGNFSYNKENEKVSLDTLPDISNSAKEIKYCVIDIKTQQFAFYNYKKTIMRTLKIIYPEFESIIQKRRILKDRFCIIPFENISKKDGNKNQINTDKFKKEILDFIKTQETIQKLFGIIYSE